MHIKSVYLIKDETKSKSKKTDLNIIELPTSIFKSDTTTTVIKPNLQIDPGESKRDTYIGGVADELTKEDLLVAVEGVDDEREQLVDLGLEGKSLGVGHCCCLSGRSRVYQGKREQPSYRRYEVMWGVVVYIYTPT